ncbi:MAG: DUF3397 domain-containing protein [Enterococcus sp.]
MEKFSPLLLFWYIYPVLVIFASNLLVTRGSLGKRFGVKAPDLAIVFLMIGMQSISSLSFGLSVIPYFLISVFLLGIVLVVFHVYYYQEIAYPRYFKMFWRLVFLFSIVVYAVLVLFSLVTFL